MYLLVLAACLSLANANRINLQFNCTNQPNGLAWWGCKAYGECIDGIHNQTDCTGDTAYNQDQRDCVNIEQAGFPCDRNLDCSQYNDTIHRIPEFDSLGDFPPCQFYYTCNYGNFAGHQICVEGLVYSEAAQDCVVPAFVVPPCGTLETNDNNAQG